MACYGVMAVASLGTLVWRHPLADVAAKSAAPIGAAFTFLALVTGSLWGKPTWGTYWVWDARLTSVLILFLIYLGLIALWQAVDDPGKAARAAAILTLVGTVNLPIIKFSVDWWNTLHQGASVFRADGPTIDPSMLWPLLVMAASMTLLFVALLLMAMRNEILRRRVRAARRSSRRQAERWRESAHAGFIIAAYLVTVAGARRPLPLDRPRRTRAQRRRLADLEARGVRRRSARDRQ